MLLFFAESAILSSTKHNAKLAVGSLINKKLNPDDHPCYPCLLDVWSA
jgi:hypothetical protein